MIDFYRGQNINILRYRLKKKKKMNSKEAIYFKYKTNENELQK